MSNIALRVDGLGKKYNIGGIQEKYRTLRDSMTDAIAAPWRRARSLLRGEAYGAAGLDQVIWALKEISFEVHHGEVVGIIGRNGAGKSTLLKVLSRITEPSEGYVELFGRVGALLEVGTGFHPELTGRENVYLNGAILGMSRTEINQKFDEIVAFAEIEKFIDTPVKHYSSGMGLRLGFAVAAHLEPEILVVDEVLAVGDVAFQQKCMGKMEDVAGEGRTVLFVSHNMAAVQNLCQRALLLDHGTLVNSGETSDIIAQYLSRVDSAQSQSLAHRTDRAGSGVARYTEVRFENGTGESSNNTLMAGREAIITLVYDSDEPGTLDGVRASITVKNQSNTELFCCWTQAVNAEINSISPKGTLVCRIPRLPLMPGKYYLDLVLSIGGRAADKITDAATLTVIEGDFFGTGKLPPKKLGDVLVDHSWTAAKNAP